MLLSVSIFAHSFCTCVSWKRDIDLYETTCLNEGLNNTNNRVVLRFILA